jgi:hypothetical protein
MVFSWLWYSIINVTLLLMEMISTQVHLKCSLAYRKCPFFVCIKYIAACAALINEFVKAYTFTKPNDLQLLRCATTISCCYINEGFTRCSKVHDGGRRKSWASWPKFSGTYSTWIQHWRGLCSQNDTDLFVFSYMSL